MRQKRKSKTRSQGGQEFNTQHRRETPAGPQLLGEGLAVWEQRELDIHLDPYSETTYRGITNRNKHKETTKQRNL